MSEAIKHVTHGPWRPDFKQIGLVKAENGAEIAKCKRLTSLVELQNRARLIAEAGTVHHETGQTPRQLAEQVKVLREALDDCLIDLQHRVRDAVTMQKASAALAATDWSKT